jgi:glycosyltransferase involved in cell wall biosynthesis
MALLDWNGVARLSVIIPAYNEQETIALVVQKVLDVPYLSEIVIVDDCSTDRTPEVCADLAARHPEVRVLRQARNQGKTAALRTGFAASTGDIVIVQDADLEYDPGEIAEVIRPIVEGVADVVYGSRFLVRRAARALYYYHYVANKLISSFSNLFTNINLTDVETGYKAFRGEIIRNMIIRSKRFGFEIEVTAKIAKLRCAIYEVPISYYGRTYEEGKKITAWDGVAAIWQIVKYNLFCGMKQSFVRAPSCTGLSKARNTNASDVDRASNPT